MRVLLNLLSVIISILVSFPVSGQVDTSIINSESLFNRTDILRFTLIGNVKQLFADRAGTAGEYDFTIIEPGLSEHDLKISTRGHYRRIPGNCQFPPLLLDFPKTKVPSNSIFHKQNKVKLVMPCQGERYIFREYLVYKLHNILSPVSFKVRLVEVTFVEKENGKESASTMGILIEDEHALADRNHTKIIEEDHISPKSIDPYNFTQAAIFQFMIGNTDWSVQYRQNIKILQKDQGEPIIVPYDFDHSGMVKAPYARPAAALQLASVSQRRYRGYCQDDLDIYKPHIDYFLSKESELYRIMQEFEHFDKSSRKYCIKFMQGFFSTLKNESKWRQAFSYPCKEGGTGNVVIKGLRE